MKDELSWRLEDIAQMLQSTGRNGDRLYNLDEWSTPILNLNTATRVGRKLVVQRNELLGALEAISRLHPHDCILTEIKQARAAIAKVRGSE